MIRPLTSLRFVFAFMVFGWHCPFYTNPKSVGFKLSQAVFGEGYIGVSFFFILSGFILSLNYAKAFERSSISRRDFWIMRFARIYPLYLLTLLAEIPFTMHEYHAQPGEWWARLTACTLMLQSWVPNEYWSTAFNLPSWSLSAEAFFYAMFPILIIRIRSLRIGMIVSLAALIMLVTSIYVLPTAWHKAVLYYNPLARIGEFAIGITLYHYRNSLLPKRWTYMHATVMELLAIALFILFLAFHPIARPVLRFSVYYWIPMAFLLYVFSRSSGAFSRWLSLPVPVLLGEVSFAFYMIHYRAGGLLKSANKRLHLDQAGLTYFLLYFCFTLAGAIAIYFLFEKPVNRFLRQKLLSSAA